MKQMMILMIAVSLNLLGCKTRTDSESQIKSGDVATKSYRDCTFKCSDKNDVLYTCHLYEEDGWKGLTEGVCYCATDEHNAESCLIENNLTHGIKEGRSGSCVTYTGGGIFSSPKIQNRYPCDPRLVLNDDSNKSRYLKYHYPKPTSQIR